MNSALQLASMPSNTERARRRRVKQQRENERREHPGRPSMYPGKNRRPNSVILTDEGRALVEKLVEKLTERENREVSRSDAIEDAIRVRAAQFGIEVQAA